MDSSSIPLLHESLRVDLAHVVRDFMHSMKQHGLSTLQIHALMYIYHAGECHMSDISALADVSNAAASQLVERLVRQGLLERQEDPANRRTKLLRLSEKGKAIVRESIPLERFLKELIDPLTAEQRTTVHAAFSILSWRFAAMHQVEKGKDGDHA